MRAHIAAVATLAVMALAAAACGPSDDEPAEDDLAADAAGPETHEELECFDADYPIEPKFDTPEEALEHAVETETQQQAVPQEADAYERVERGEDSVDFEYQDGPDVHHTWGISRDVDGRWGMTSLGGCVPAGFLLHD